MIYTDKACSASGATAAPIPGELLDRIAREESREHSLRDDDLLEDAYVTSQTRWDDASGDARAMRTTRRNPARGCARSPTQLAMDLGASLAGGDVNRIAENYHWTGLSTRTGGRVMDRLQHLTGKRVLDSHYFDAQIGFADAGTGDSSMRGGDAGMLQVVLSDEGSRSAIDFDVHRYAGCYFVSF